MIRPRLPAISRLSWSLRGSAILDRAPARRSILHEAFATGPIGANRRVAGDAWRWRPAVEPRLTDEEPRESAALRPDALRRLRRPALATAALRALRVLRRFNRDGCFAASGALSYTTLVSLVPLARHRSRHPIGLSRSSRRCAEQLAGAGVPRLSCRRSASRRRYWFGNFADSAAQTTAIGIDRHRRHRRSAAGDGRGSAEPDLAGRRRRGRGCSASSPTGR